ncbi:MAG TPA: pyridoxal-phosphate dependent enzyme [Kofleriaceae bacterium]|nr:pyridoxal-phosphate dependent enzyme [Kofleriaceae bacterium]
MSALPTEDQVRAARELLRRHLPVTRLVPAPSLTGRLGAPVWLKLESDLPTGSFKPRGALHALASRLDRQVVREVVACSTGNHGAAVAYAANVMRVPATIYLPRNPNPVKRAKIAALGARIVEVGDVDTTGAAGAARDHACRQGVYFLDDATDPDLPAGPATIALEILEQAPEVGAILVPIGDSALIRGIAAAARRARPTIRVIGVQATAAPSYYLSWKQGGPVETESCDTIADGLATRIPQPASVDALRVAVDDILLVSEEQMLDAIRHLIIEEHVVAEPAGAATTAAALAGGALDGPTALLVTGANLSPEVLSQL